MVLAASLLAVGAPAAEEIPLSGWAAPPYWQAGGTGAEAGTGPGSRVALALPSSPLPFVAITPCRQYDSRTSSPLLDNTPRTVPLIGAPCGLPVTAQAAAVNITVFSIVGAGSNGVFKVGVVTPPTTAWINYPPTETQRGNAGVVALTGAGEIVVQVNQGAGSVHFVVDVAGYYAPTGIVNTVNTLSGDVTLAQGSNVTITPSGNTLTIAASGSGATGPTGPTGPAGGPTGPAGPTGPTGPVSVTLSGVSNVLGVPFVDPFVPLAGPITSGGDESLNSLMVPADCPTASFRVRFDVPPGALNPTLTFALRVNGVDSTTVTCAVPGTATTCTPSPTAPLAAGDLVTLHVTTAAPNYGAASALWVALRCP